MTQVNDNEEVPPETTRRMGLGPKQLAWCDEKIQGFATMRKQALAAAAHRDEVRKKAGLT